MVPWRSQRHILFVSYPVFIWISRGSSKSTVSWGKRVIEALFLKIL
jgi:hypothetical protein